MISNRNFNWISIELHWKSSWNFNEFLLKISLKVRENHWKSSWKLNKIPMEIYLESSLNFNEIHVKILMKYWLKSIWNPVDFQWNTNRNPFKIQLKFNRNMKCQWKSVGNPVEISIKYHWKSIGNQGKISMKFQSKFKSNTN